MDMSAIVLTVLTMSAAASDSQEDELPLGLTLTDFEKSGVFRAAKKLADWRGVSIADVLALAPLALAARGTAGGARARAGRPARNWAEVTSSSDAAGVVPGFSLLEIDLALVVEGALGKPGASAKHAFAAMMERRAGTTPAKAAKLYDAFVDARLHPPKGAVDELAARRSARRAARALAG